VAQGQLRALGLSKATPTRRVQSGRRRAGLRIHRAPTLAANETTTHHGIPVTTPVCRLRDEIAKVCRFPRRPFDASIEQSIPHRGGIRMRVMVIVKATPESEAGQLPSTEMLEAMGKYNEELVKAGVMLAGEGLHPSSKGARVRFAGTDRTVVDGPFAETKELIAGFWLWEVRDMDEAIEWVRRCPNPMEGESEIEIRRVFEADDFGENLTPELREAEERLRAETAARQP
jgi:hypothetical protein